MKKILFIHQSAELYGSDKTLLLLLKHLDKTKFYPVVILPNDGPLKIELEKGNVEVQIAPVLKLYRKMFSPKNLITFFSDIKKGVTISNELHKKYHFDIVYSNTLAVLLGLFFVRKTKIKHIWHVHEIIESPSVFKKAFMKILSLKSTSSIIYNSIATKTFWETNNEISKKGVVVWNGVENNDFSISDNEIDNFRTQNFNATQDEIIIGLVGRISRWKGQQILLNSFEELSKNNKNIKLVYVGSPPPNQEIFLQYLKQQIKEKQLTDKVTILPFRHDISTVWHCIDIAVVPSTEPEPFGLVAIEAMFAKKPVIGSNHGGLTEIVINNETGFLVEPNNQKQLSEALQELITNQKLREQFGNAGLQRAKSEFSVDKYVSSIENLFDKILK